MTTKEPKIFVGVHNSIVGDDYDVIIFTPENFSGSTEEITRNARLKFIELSERKHFEETKVQSGVHPVRDREKRKRIVR